MRHTNLQVSEEANLIPFLSLLQKGLEDVQVILSKYQDRSGILMKIKPAWTEDDIGSA